MSQKTSSKLLQSALVGAGAATAATFAANFLIAKRTPQMGLRLNGDFGRYPSRHGDLAFCVAGSGAPLLLLHGLEAGRSHAEWNAVFDVLADNYTVYALDWLGWGLSDAPPDGYTAKSFAEAATHFIHDVIGAPTSVLAAGGGAIFAVLAAQNGAPIEKLGLVCPVPPAFDPPTGQSRAEQIALSALTGRVLKAPVYGAAALNWLHSRPNLEKWARGHGFFDKSRAHEAVQTLHTTAHQPGAFYGQVAFLQGDFEADWRAAWEGLEIPSLLVWGRNALRDGFDSAPEWLALQPQARLEVIENALLLPHWEQPARFTEIVLPWLQKANPKTIQKG